VALTIVSGIAGNVQQETEVYGAQSSAYTGATRVHSQKVINFRVDNKPVTLKLKATIDLAEGDDVTVVGTDKRGILRALVVRNDKTGIVYSHSPIMLIVLGGILGLVGLATISILLGFIIAPLGFYVVYKGLQTKKAIGMLKSPASFAGAG
jgi:hypothetical protein